MTSQSTKMDLEMEKEQVEKPACPAVPPPAAAEYCGIPALELSLASSRDTPCAAPTNKDAGSDAPVIDLQLAIKTYATSESPHAKSLEDGIDYLEMPPEEQSLFRSLLVNNMQTPLDRFENMPTLLPSAQRIIDGIAEHVPPGDRDNRNADGNLVTKVNFILFRHGQTDQNVETVENEAIDCPLNLEGVQQCRDAGLAWVSRKDSEERHYPDLYLCSPLARTVQSLELLRESCCPADGAAPVFLVPLLREKLLNYGFIGGEDQHGGSCLDPARLAHLTHPILNGDGTEGNEDAWADLFEEPSAHRKFRAWQGIGFALKTAVEFAKRTGRSDLVVLMSTHNGFAKDFIKNMCALSGEQLGGVEHDIANAELKTVYVSLKTDKNGFTSMIPRSNGDLVSFGRGIVPPRDVARYVDRAKYARRIRRKNEAAKEAYLAAFSGQPS